jgi:hypothetical protein
MSKSLWSIVVLGFITVIIMVIMMLFSLSVYQKSPAANRAKFSNQIRETFGFTEVGAGVRDTGKHLTLRIEFLSAIESNFSDDVMNMEIDRVVEFARKRYDGKDRRFITQMVVRRTEIQGSGCWKRTLDRERTVEEPFRLAVPVPEETEDP